MKVSDLITDPATRAEGFESQAAKKSELMKRYIDRGLQAINELQKSKKNFSDMSKELQDFFIAAAGLSRKSLQHLDQKTIEKIIMDILPMDDLSNNKIVNDILYRFLLTSGDALGGEMRNIIGDLGQTKLIEVFEEYSNNNKIKYEIKCSKSEKVSEFIWQKQRIIFNKKPKFIDKSIDIIVLKKDGDLENPLDYLACGELKSGIDPAGADEHWKTAKSALARIRDNFNRRKINPPYLFFIGAAIENSMAAEAVEMLKTGELDFAANLYKEDHLEQMIKEIFALS
jgi:type II restriction enzyme